MNTPTSDFQRGAIRVSDAERDQAVAELTEHYQAGRLTLAEFDDRSSSALQARTGNDLDALFTDLPHGAAPAVRIPASPVAPADPRPARPTSGGPTIARAIIACVIAAIVLGNVAGGHDHHYLGWLVPVVILGLVFLRLSRRHR